MMGVAVIEGVELDEQVRVTCAAAVSESQVSFEQRLMRGLR
jgi:hypothetical protein